MVNPDELLNEINAKAKEIHTDAYPMSIGELMTIYRDGELDIHPEFQRFFRWTDLQKSKFIESILLGIPIPSIFVSQREDGVWDVVDGVQRLSTIFEFTGMLKNRQGKILSSSRLVATEYLPCLASMAWEDKKNPATSFPNSLKIDFKRQKLDLKIVKKESDKNAKYDLFERLNTLGSQLSDQEVRNCMLVMVNPKMYEWLDSLSHFQPFQDAIALTEHSLEERYDMELVLRFLILNQLEEKSFQGVNDVALFVTHEMRGFASNPAFNQDFEKAIFEKTFSVLYKTLGPGCFVRIDSARGKGGFRISVFEVVAGGLGWNIGREPNKPIEGKHLQQTYRKAFTDSTFKEYSKSGRSATSRLPKLVPLGRKLFKLV